MPLTCCCERSEIAPLLRRMLALVVDEHNSACGARRGGTLPVSVFVDLVKRVEQQEYLRR